MRRGERIAQSGLRWAAATVTLLGCAAGAWGCSLVFDPNRFHVTAGDDAASPNGPDGQAPASDGGGGDGCTPGQDRRSLENACTGAMCVPFGTAVPSCDGGLCPLGAPPALPEAGTTTATTDAGTACTQVRPDPKDIVFVTGSTALSSFVQEVSKALAIRATNPVTVVYQGSGSCSGVNAAIDPGNHPMVPSGGATTYYDATGTQQSCSLDPTTGVVADIGASDVFYSTCYQGSAVVPTLPQGVADSFGPVQIMNFAVPQASSQRSISLSAAYYVFGFGGSAYTVPPWTDPTQLQVRSASSGTQAMISAAIGVPAAVWFGKSNGSSGAVGTALVTAGASGDSHTIDSALGILASDYLVKNSQTLRGLAVEDQNAGCAFYPGSTATARDNANTRDGHYPLWGPSHFYTRVDAQTQVPLKSGVTDFVDGLSGVTALQGLDLVAEYASAGLVPLCAMHVARSSDGGGYQPYKAATTCNCYFDLTATGVTTCSTCNTDADCPTAAPSCNKFGPPPQQGYCDL